jgi:hypothetical protein
VKIFSRGCVVVAEERGLGEAGPAVQRDQGRVADVFAADEHPLVEVAQAKISGLGDAPREDFALGP